MLRTSSLCLAKRPVINQRNWAVDNAICGYGAIKIEPARPLEKRYAMILAIKCVRAVCRSVVRSIKHMLRVANRSRVHKRLILILLSLL